jgi:hypothetical protein
MLAQRMGSGISLKIESVQQKLDYHQSKCADWRLCGNNIFCLLVGTWGLLD